MKKTDFFICKLLAILPLLFCFYSIFNSSSLLLSVTLTVATTMLFFLSRGNPIIPYFLIALGPFIGLSAIFQNSYIYNSELILFIFTGCLWIKNDIQNTLFHLKKDLIFQTLIFLLITVAGLSLLHIIYLKTEIAAEIRLVRLYISALFMLLFVKTARPKDIVLFYKTIVLTSMFIAIIGIIQFIVNVAINKSYSEPISIFSNSESLAIYLCITVTFIIAYKNELSTKNWAAAVYLSAILMIILLIFTRSRTAIISISIFIVLNGLIHLKFREALKTRVLITIITFLSAGLVIVFFKTFNHNMVLADNFLNILFSSRIQAWSEGLELFSRSSIWGNGPVSNVYNQYLQILCQYGIVGFVVFATFVCALLFKYIKKVTANNILFRCSLWPIISLTIAGIGETVLGNQLGYYIFFIILLSEMKPELYQKIPDHTLNSITPAS